MLGGPAITFNSDKSGQLILATDGAGFFVTDVGDSTPHGGNVRSVIGTIAGADYDDGSQGFDVPAGARGDALRGLKTGQWAKYTVNVPATGYYDISASVASGSGGRFHLEFNGVNVTGPVEIKVAAGPKAWAEVRISHVRLIAGDQYMKFFAETNGLDFSSIGMGNEN